MSADDLVQFKVYIDSGLNDEEDREVRQFGIESGVATNFSYITEKLKSVFPCLENVNDLHIYWKDTENDKIRISTDTELIAALTQMEQEVKKLYVKLVASEVEGDAADDAQQQHEAVTENDNNDLPQLHEDIICDGCDGPIVGFRYKCLQCPNFDLCSTCEATGSHPQHYMLRMTKQANTGLKIKAFDAGEKRKWHFHLKGHGPFGHGGPFGHEHHKGPMMGAGFHHEHGHHKGPMMGPGFHHEHGHHKGPMMGPGFHHEHGHHKGPMMGPGFHHEHRHHKGPMMGPGFHHEHEHHKGPMMGHGFPPGRFCPYSKIHAMKHGKKHMKKHMKHLKKQFKAFC